MGKAHKISARGCSDGQNWGRLAALSTMGGGGCIPEVHLSGTPLEIISCSVIALHNELGLWSLLCRERWCQEISASPPQG